MRVFDFLGGRGKFVLQIVVVKVSRPAAEPRTVGNHCAASLANNPNERERADRRIEQMGANGDCAAGKDRRN